MTWLESPNKPNHRCLFSYCALKRCSIRKN